MKRVPPPRQIYESPRLVQCYKSDRPVVHRAILEQVMPPKTKPILRALDIGCGAGLSAACLVEFANVVHGVDPSAAMISAARASMPNIRFVRAEAERLPFEDAAFGLVSAAGSLNYSDLPAALREISRVLEPAAGQCVIYDYASGRRALEESTLPEWFDAFEQRYPFATGYEFDVAHLPLASWGLELRHLQTVRIPLAHTREDFLRYVLSETNVEAALGRGDSLPEIRAWCDGTLSKVFGARPLTIVFAGYAAILGRL